MSSEAGNRLYTTGEIALTMAIVFIFLTIPTTVGIVYYFFYM